MNEHIAWGSETDQVAALDDALELQIRELAAVADEVDDIRLELPKPGHGDRWEGPAHSAYVVGVDILTKNLATAQLLVDHAVQHSRRAAGTLAGYAG